MKIKDIIKEYDDKYTQLKSAIINEKYGFTDEIIDFVEYINTEVDKKTIVNNKAGRPPDLKKYIQKTYLKNSTFKLEDYYEKFPQQQKYSDKYEKQISQMITDKMLLQLKDKDFKVC